MKMALADITLVPIGEKYAGFAEEVAALHDELDKHQDKVKYEITSMSTIIEGEISDVFTVIQKLHARAVERDWKRISMNIRIDDRRDGEEHSIEGKKARVEQLKK